MRYARQRKCYEDKIQENIMKMKEPKTMQELHKIREELYNETKHLSLKEKVEYIHKEAEEVKRRYNLKLPCKG